MNIFQKQQTTIGYTSIPEASADDKTAAVGHRSSWKTKNLMCAGIIGMTAAVASSTLVFYSIMDKQTSTVPSFLLHASVDADDNKCLPASGPWPAGSVSNGNGDVDDEPTAPFVTCYTFQGGENYCWTHSYYDDGWRQCFPDGDGWSIFNPNTEYTTSSFLWFPDHKMKRLPVEGCGTGCTAVSKTPPNDDGTHYVTGV